MRDIDFIELKDLNGMEIRNAVSGSQRHQRSVILQKSSSDRTERSGRCSGVDNMDSFERRIVIV